MNDFTEALKHEDISSIRRVPKSDLHNHSMMGGRLSRLSELTGIKISAFTGGEKGVHGINEWIGNELKAVMVRQGGFESAAEAAFLQAREDGISLLEMSMDAFLGTLINIPAQRIVSVLKETHERIAPEIEFRPELGFARSLPMRTIFKLAEQYLATGYFRSVDLYDIEDAQPVENFSELYRFFRKEGLKLKAHAGEFGDAESVRKAVELLDLDAIQHGIGAAGSVEVMEWLASRGTVLNVSPESNIILKRASSYKTHPIRILFDHGVKVTVSTDDVMLFDKGNSEQYLDLYKSGAFSAEELDLIRRNGLEN